MEFMNNLTLRWKLLLSFGGGYAFVFVSAACLFPYRGYA